MSKSHKIRIYADINYPDSPRDFISLDTVKVRNANPLTVDCIFLEGGNYADVNSATKAELEILDVGAYNCPTPRSVALIARSEATLNTQLHANTLAEKSCTAPIHASFNLSADQMNLLSQEEPYPEKYLRISLCYESGEKVCYSSGWIEVLENFDSNPNYSPISSPEYYTKDEIESLLNNAIVGKHSHENYLEKSSNLSDLQDAAASRTNLDVYSKSETDTHLQNISESLEDRISGISALASQNASHISDNLTQILNVENIASDTLTQVGDLTSKVNSIESDVMSHNNSLQDIESEKISLLTNKQDKSELWFNSGRMYVDTSKTDYTQLDLTKPFSILVRVKMMDEEGRFSINTADYNNGKRGFMFLLNNYATYTWQLITYRGDKSTKAINIAMPNINDAKYHTIELIYNGTDLTLYVDGKIPKRTDGINNATVSPNWSGMVSPFATFPIFIGSPSSMSALSMKCRVRDLFAFNFDARGENAPYTIADYQNGVDIPPSLLDANAEQKAILALANYTFNGEILDVSGGGNHASFRGEVKGTHDTAVETLYQKIASRIGNNS